MSSSWRPGGKSSEKEDVQPNRTVTVNVNACKQIFMLLSMKLLIYFWSFSFPQRTQGRNWQTVLRPQNIPGTRGFPSLSGTNFVVLLIFISLEFRFSW